MISSNDADVYEDYASKRIVIDYIKLPVPFSIYISLKPTLHLFRFTELLTWYIKLLSMFREFLTGLVTFLTKQSELGRLLSEVTRQLQFCNQFSQ